MTCVVINLDKRPDRLEAFKKEFEREAPGHTLERFPARTSSVAQNAVVNGRIGCMLSHRGVVELARDRGLEYVVVFEDDVTLVPGAGERWVRAIEQLGARPWWKLFLGQNTQGPVLKQGENLYRVSRSLTTHAVVYHRRSYEGILKRLPVTESEALPFVARHKAVDVYFSRHVIPLVPSYCVWPHLAHQRPDVSDIQGNATQLTHDDDRTERWIVDSAASYGIRCAAWKWGRRPVHRLMERITCLRKRKFYAAAPVASA
ncbi:MAG: glycosyltransferase family 25 protein [Planctomycetota bacterium]